MVEKCGFDPLPEGRILQTRCRSHRLSFSVVFCEGDHGNAPCYPGSKPGIVLLDSSPIILFAPQAGLEPARPEENALTVRRSTNYAHCGAKKTRNHKNIRYPVIVSHVSDFPMNILVIIWSRVSGSNRCELFASGLEDRCSSNWAKERYCDPIGTRTRNPLIKSEVLYHWATKHYFGWPGAIRTLTWISSKLISSSVGIRAIILF